MFKSITLTVGMGLALCCAASSQINWFTKNYPVGSSGYLPKLGTDAVGNFILVDQQATGISLMNYETGSVSGGNPTMTWNAPFELPVSTGHAPSVALNGVTVPNPQDPGTFYTYNLAVEVHQGGAQDNQGTLYYHVGVAPEAASSAIQPLLNWAVGGTLGSGYNPSLSTDPFSNGCNNTCDSVAVVEVHQSGENMSGLWYRVGYMGVSDSGALLTSWGSAQPLNEQGYAPSVAVNDDFVVEVHEGSGGTLWYTTGTVGNNGTITWHYPSVPYGTGYNPSIAFSGEPYSLGVPFYFVEVHQLSNPGAGESASLYINTGNLASNGSTINWSGPIPYETGCYPTVGAGFDYGSGSAIAEVHSAACGKVAPLYYDYGEQTP